ncbi:leucine-rich repeat LGI family [Pimephales promelas]|nr:leucine-rich repeat LGI family [Pimephales promelas]
MLQDRQNFLQENGSSKETLQANASSVEELQTNVSSVDELKNEEDVDFTHPPETVPQSLSPESNAFPTKQAKKVKKGRKARFNLPEGSSPSPMLQRVNKDEVQRVKDGLKQEIASSIKEPKKSLQDSMEKRHVAEIGDLIQNYNLVGMLASIGGRDTKNIVTSQRPFWLSSEEESHHFWLRKVLYLCLTRFIGDSKILRWDNQRFVEIQTLPFLAFQELNMLAPRGFSLVSIDNKDILLAASFKGKTMAYQHLVVDLSAK